MIIGYSAGHVEHWKSAYFSDGGGCHRGFLFDKTQTRYEKQIVLDAQSVDVTMTDNAVRND